MPEVTEYAPGTPSWAELSTPDEAGSLSFYSAMFGWQDDPQEIGEGSGWYYHMQKLNGQYACSIYKQGEEERSQNLPPRWNVYFTVNNVDESVETIKRSGGTVVFGPMDFFEAGRMAFCQDPQGAFFAIWQAKQHIGAGVKFDVGAMCWNELLTTDRSAAIEFYLAALGMERGYVAEAMDYPMLKAGGTERLPAFQKLPAICPPCRPTGASTSLLRILRRRWLKLSRWARRLTSPSPTSSRRKGRLP